MEIDEKSLLDQFLILYITEVQKLLTFRLFIFVRVQQHVAEYGVDLFVRGC